MNNNRWKILHVVNVGTFMSTLDVGIINVALPTMANQFGVSLAQIQWVVTSYLLTLVVLLPFFGRISDRLDRSKVYSYGFLIFSLGSLLITLFTYFPMVIFSRCIQGFGATMIMANSQAMVRQVFPNHERGKALGFNAVIISLGTLSGPALGGILLEYFGWPALFLINVPLGIIAMVLGFRLFPAIQNPVKERLDLLGSILLAGGAVLLLLGTVDLQQKGYSKLIVFELISGLIMLIALFLYEKKIKNGIVDMTLFSDRTISIGNASGFLINMSQMAVIIPITFYLQGILGYSAWKTGIILSLQPLIMGMIAPFSGWYRDRFGAKVPLVIGTILCTISLVPLLFTSQTSLLEIIIAIGVFGAGTGFFLSINNAEIMSATPEGKISLSGSTLALIRYFGMIVGIGLAATFAGKLGSSSKVGQPSETHMQYLFIICFISCLITIGLNFLRIERKQVTKKATMHHGR